MVPPITAPDSSSSRARYQIEGAVSIMCGSLARSVPPAAEREGSAAQAFEAPARSPRAKGDKGSSAIRSAAWEGSAPGTSEAYSGSAATPGPGASAIRSATRASGSSSDRRARSTSASRCDESCTPISFRTASESAGRQGAISEPKRNISGAPRPRAPSLTCASHALTPSE